MLSSDFRKIGWGLEFWLVCRRTFLDIYRNPMYMKARIGQSIFSGLMALALFWNLGFDLDGITTKLKLMYFIVIDQTMMTMFPVLMVFLNEREVFIREYANHTYGVISYYLAKTFIELPFLGLMTILYSTVLYFGVGFDTSFEAYFWFNIVLLFIVL
jgi:ABC-type multidrug transport system permease subunit